MATHSLETRILAHLERRIHLFECLLEEISLFESLPDNADFDNILEAQRRRAADIEHLLREYNALHREWQAARATPEERARVQTQSQRAEALAEHVQTRIEAVTKLTQSRGTGYKNALDEMKRGQGMLRKYRGGHEDSAGYFDRNA